MRFLSSKNHLIFCFHFFSNKSRKSWILAFQTLPKPSQNPFKIDVPKNMRFFIEFCSKNALLQRRHRFRIGFSNTFCLSGTFLRIAFRMHFGSKKPTKNQSKTTSEPFKNRCQKYVVFQHRFFRVSASILEGLGPPSWSQVGYFGYQRGRMRPSKSLLKLNVFKKWRVGKLQARFWSLRASILEALGLDFGRF